MEPRLLFNKKIQKADVEKETESKRTEEEEAGYKAPDLREKARSIKTKCDNVAQVFNKCYLASSDDQVRLKVQLEGGDDLEMLKTTTHISYLVCMKTQSILISV